MSPEQDRPNGANSAELLRRVSSISRAVLRRARTGMSRIELLQEISTLLLDASPVAVAEWWLREGGGYFHCAVSRGARGQIRWEVDNLDVTNPAEGTIVGTRDQQALNRIYLDLINPEQQIGGAWRTSGGSFWTCESCPGLSLSRSPQAPSRAWRLESQVAKRCFVLIPLRGFEEDLGFTSLQSEQRRHFSRADIEFQELVAETVAVALVHQDAQSRLRERIKELGCLYEVLRLADDPELSTQEILEGIANLLPAAWQYPEKAAGRIVFDGVAYCSRDFAAGPQVQSAPIDIGGRQRGSIEVVYLETRPPVFEGPFLREERHLINALAREVSGIIERRQIREDKARLEDQLRHADRLATIGQLAAGVAHELNEPLGNILGFAQLAGKCDSLAPATRRDLERIVEACLYSRNVVSKLKLFARQMPNQRCSVDLNKMVLEELFFVEARCARQGIRIERDLDTQAARLQADPGQLYQVLVNLAVNAIQAMPDGGTLAISTRRRGDRIVLAVADTGSGMTREVLGSIFVPFFTTKGPDEGTGLGLSVVHGIVSAHGGEIVVDSKPGQGSRFEVRLPVGEGPAEPGG